MAPRESVKKEMNEAIWNKSERVSDILKCKSKKGAGGVAPARIIWVQYFYSYLCYYIVEGVWASKPGTEKWSVSHFLIHLLFVMKMSCEVVI